jgi:outer membrane receptor protein involved in Fe transport
MDFHSSFGSALSPKLGINYKILDRLRFRTSIGRSFRAPSLAELYMPNITINPDFVLKCNPDLKPEYLAGMDGGFEALLWKTLTIKIDVYYNKMQNLISQAVVLDASGAFVTHRNISSAWSDGIEPELQWRPVPWFRVSANGSIQNSLDETYQSKLDYVPDYTFGCRTGFSPRIYAISSNFTLGYRQVGPRRYLDFTKAILRMMPDGQLQLRPLLISLDPYHAIDFSMKFTVARYSLSLTAQNILNATWEESGGTLAPGRFAAMKLGISF